VLCDPNLLKICVLLSLVVYEQYRVTYHFSTKRTKFSS